MSVGAGMATIGYYAVEPLGEFRNGTTVRVKQEQKGLHLNNLSYVGPIIMGFGGEFLSFCTAVKAVKSVLFVPLWLKYIFEWKNCQFFNLFVTNQNLRHQICFTSTKIFFMLSRYFFFIENLI